jgi:F-type H+-transporting ATPase subunit b
MLIDWFTVGAQALNFLILVWLMKRFLYKPILIAIDAREKLIAKELADADAKKAEACQERDEFASKNREIDQARTSLLAKAAEEAMTEQHRLLDEARKAADAMSAKRQDQLQSDTRNLHAAISRRTRDEVFAIARKALSDLATCDLEERMVVVFERRLRELDERTRSILIGAMKSAAEPALVRCVFDLPARQRDDLQRAINVMCSTDIHLRFETAPDIIAGIELTSSGNKVSWSIGEYLTALEKAVEDLVQKQALPAPKEATATATRPEPAPTSAAAADHVSPTAAPPPGSAAAPDPQAAEFPAMPAAATADPAQSAAAPEHLPAPSPVPHATANPEAAFSGAANPSSSTPPVPKPAQKPA